MDLGFFFENDEMCRGNERNFSSKYDVRINAIPLPPVSRIFPKILICCETTKCHVGESADKHGERTKTKRLNCKKKKKKERGEKLINERKKDKVCKKKKIPVSEIFQCYR